MTSTVLRTKTSPATTAYTAFPTRLGPQLYVAYDEASVVRNTDFQLDEEDFLNRCEAKGLGRPMLSEPPVDLSEQVRLTLEGKTTFEGRLDYEQVPGFYRRVLQATAAIPWGAVRPYGWLAQQVGAPGAGRAVGTAMATNPFPLLIPCHRVIRSDFTIGNYGCGGSEVKRALLMLEGIDVETLGAAARRGFRYMTSAPLGYYCQLGCSRRDRRSESVRYFVSESQAISAGLKSCEVCLPAR